MAKSKNKKNTRYDQIDRSYGNHLERESEAVISTLEPGGISLRQTFRRGSSQQSGAGTSMPFGDSAVQETPVKNEQSIGDLWINSFVRSKNWKPKKNGFWIDGPSGYAEFSNVFISGEIQAATGIIGGFTIGEDTLSASAGGNTTILSSGPIAISAGPTGSPTFTLTQAGVLSATGATISGTITASQGVIGGFTIGASTLSATSGGNTTTLSSGSVAISIGPTGSPNFTLTQLGILSASGATISGTITATNLTASQGTIGGTTISASALTGGVFQTATSGYRLRMSGADNSYQFLNNSLVLAELKADIVPNTGTAGALLDHPTGHAFLGVSGSAGGGYSLLGGTSGYLGVFSTNIDSWIQTNLTFQSDIVPSADLSYTLGSPSKKWSTVYTYTISGLTTLNISGTGTFNTVNANNTFNLNNVTIPRIYSGYLSGTTITNSNSNPFTVTNPGTGRYLFTHNWGTLNYTIQATAVRATGDGAYIAKISDRSSNSFEITIFNDSGTAVNSDLVFVVFRN